MKTKYLKGFTVLEALISLILMSIIITLTYSVYNIIEKQMLLFKNEHESVLEYNLFNSTFKGDIYNVEDFYAEDNTINLRYYDDTSISYYFNQSAIIRVTEVKTDTFKLPVLEFKIINPESTYPGLELTTKILTEPIETNYYLKKSIANSINNHYFNED